MEVIEDQVGGRVRRGKLVDEGRHDVLDRVRSVGQEIQGVGRNSRIQGRKGRCDRRPKAVFIVVPPIARYPGTTTLGLTSRSMRQQNGLADTGATGHEGAREL